MAIQAKETGQEIGEIEGADFFFHCRRSILFLKLSAYSYIMATAQFRKPEQAEKTQIASAEPAVTYFASQERDAKRVEVRFSIEAPEPVVRYFLANIIKNIQGTDNLDSRYVDGLSWFIDQYRGQIGSLTATVGGVPISDINQIVPEIRRQLGI